ncbi:MAG: hypothetical protein EOO51_12285 [Flavobacterium sp.]|nr:MAG: hypothetical protein EOO51_12285 [Flavobacterium sp.]
MRNFLHLIVAATLLVGCSAKKQDNTAGSVYFIPSLHNFHKINKNYSYDSLKAIITRFRPDVIAVEIRTEDIAADTLYLKNNYPLEMRQMKYWFPGVKVVGFDWLGEELEGKPIPQGYWKNISQIKKLERELAADSLMQARLKRCYGRKEEREKLLRSLTLNELISSADSDIVNSQYACYDLTVHNTPFQPLSDFFKERNAKLLVNIKKVITENPGKRILIVTGDDHYAALKDKFDHL